MVSYNPDQNNVTKNRSCRRPTWNDTTTKSACQIHKVTENNIETERKVGCTGDGDLWRRGRTERSWLTGGMLRLRFPFEALDEVLDAPESRLVRRCTNGGRRGVLGVSSSEAHLHELVLARGVTALRAQPRRQHVGVLSRGR